MKTEQLPKLKAEAKEPPLLVSPQVPDPQTEERPDTPPVVMRVLSMARFRGPMGGSSSMAEKSRRACERLICGVSPSRTWCWIPRTE